MSFAKCLVVFLAAVASVNGLATGGHSARHGLHRRSLAARVAEPQPVSEDIPIIARRAPAHASSRRRCKPRASSSSSLPSPSASQSLAVPPVNPAPVPSSSRIRTSTRAAEPTPAPPKATPTPKPSPPDDDKDDDNNSNLPSYMRGTQSGEATFYTPGLGACGLEHTENDLVAAVSMKLFDTFPGYNRVNPNSNPVCKRSVTVRYQGKSVTVEIIDRCVGCQVGDLDLSPAAFGKLADFGVGRIRQGMTWTWN